MGDRITKIELEQLLNARNAELEAARLQIAELQGQLLAARGTAPSVRRERPVRPVDPEVLRRRAAMAAARAAAMAGGHSVLVEL